MKDNRIFNVLIIVFVVFLVSLTVLVNVTISNKAKEAEYIGKSPNFRNIITVSGEGEIYARPDLGLAVFSVTNEHSDVQQALAENTRNTNRIIDFLKENGIEERDMKTTNFNIFPRYEYIEQGIFSSGKRVLAGYQVIQSVEVKIREIEETGKIIEGAIKSGANEVSGIRFIIENEEEYLNEARTAAIEDAKRKAKDLSGHLGVKLARITNYNESGSPIIYSPSMDMSREAFGMGGESAPDIQTGENLIRVMVNVSYEIE